MSNYPFYLSQLNFDGKPRVDRIIDAINSPVRWAFGGRTVECLNLNGPKPQFIDKGKPSVPLRVLGCAICAIAFAVLFPLQGLVSAIKGRALYRRIQSKMNDPKPPVVIDFTVNKPKAPSPTPDPPSSPMLDRKKESIVPSDPEETKPESKKNTADELLYAALKGRLERDQYRAKYLEAFKKWKEFVLKNDPKASSYEEPKEKLFSSFLQWISIYREILRSVKNSKFFTEAYEKNIQEWLDSISKTHPKTLNSAGYFHAILSSRIKRLKTMANLVLGSMPKLSYLEPWKAHLSKPLFKEENGELEKALLSNEMTGIKTVAYLYSLFLPPIPSTDAVPDLLFATTSGSVQYASQLKSSIKESEDSYTKGDLIFHLFLIEKSFFFYNQAAQEFVKEFSLLEKRIHGQRPAYMEKKKEEIEIKLKRIERTLEKTSKALKGPLAESSESKAVAALLHQFVYGAPLLASSGDDITNANLSLDALQGIFDYFKYSIIRSDSIELSLELITESLENLFRQFEREIEADLAGKGLPDSPALETLQSYNLQLLPPDGSRFNQTQHFALQFEPSERIALNEACTALQSKTLSKQYKDVALRGSKELAFTQMKVDALEKALSIWQNVTLVKLSNNPI